MKHSMKYYILYLNYFIFIIYEAFQLQLFIIIIINSYNNNIYIQNKLSRERRVYY
jgi:hypothetical protein